MVNAMWGTDETVLTLSQVRTWQMRQQEIGDTIQALQEEAADISRKLDAVRVIMGALPGNDVARTLAVGEQSPQTAPESGREEFFPESLIEAVRTLGGAPRPNEIRTWLCEHGATNAIKTQAGKPYFYAVLMRHARAGRLIRVGKGYSLPKSSAQAETGADDPGPL